MAKSIEKPELEQSLKCLFGQVRAWLGKIQLVVLRVKALSQEHSLGYGTAGNNMKCLTIVCPFQYFDAYLDDILHPPFLWGMYHLLIKVVGKHSVNVLSRFGE